MTLDTRATRATRSINQAVTGATPVAMKAIAGRRRRSFGAGLVGALAVLFASVALAATLPVFDSTEVAHGDDTPTVIDTPTGDPILHRAVTDSPEPYALLSGIAAPGTIVTATSEYGAADLVVGEHEEWVLKVYFENPPPGVEFPILLTVGDEVYTYGFTSLWDPSKVEITAHQAFGVSDDAHPFARYYGTAPPGTVVTAVSEFGSADTTAGEEGHWELGVWFEGAPAGEGFPVTVTVGDEVFHFTFVWLQPGEGGDEIEVTVAQVGTTSESKTPYTQFVGTAPQGTHVLATSEYGSADLEVGESGEFTLKLWFSPLPPAGKKFPIIVKIDDEVFGEYHFTSYYEAPPSGEVTVHQYNNASDDPYPWVKFYGTAPKGTHIQILSPYGSWSWNTEAVEWNSGQKYFSPMPPAGQTFDITVKVDGETFGVYQFTSWFDSDQVTIHVVKTAAEGPEPYTRIEYWAPAGTTIQLSSDYGSTTKNIEATGGGDLKLWFSPLPPSGVPFTVTIKVNGDVWDTYQFTSHYSEDTTPVTINHAFGSCNLDPPYDDLWGTAPAGTQIKIISEYGSSTFTVGESGAWEKRQYFEGAPYGVPFTVTVKVNGETHTTYQFTVYQPEA